MPSTKLSSKPKPKQQLAFEAIGTWWVIDIEYDGDLHKLQRAIMPRIEAFDKTYSRFRPDSLITAVSKKAGTFTFPDDAPELFALYRRLYDATNGAFTPLIGDVMNQAGYDAGYSLTPGKLHRPPAWDDVLSFNKAKLTTTHPVTLDFGAAGKGYLVDIITTTIKNYGISTFCIDASGDMHVATDRGAPIRVGLEHPDDPGKIIGLAELTNQSLCGSAGNRRAWANFHHIIDPYALASPKNIKAVWIVAATTLLADGLATALFFVPPEALSQFAFDYVIVYADDTAAMSPTFPGKLFVAPVL